MKSGDIEQAELSTAIYICDRCRESTPEQFTMTEAELRAALDAGEVDCMRFHDGCPRGLAVERVRFVQKTLAGVLSAPDRATGRGQAKPKRHCALTSG